MLGAVSSALRISAGGPLRSGIVVQTILNNFCALQFSEIRFAHFIAFLNQFPCRGALSKKESVIYSAKWIVEVPACNSSEGAYAYHCGPSNLEIMRAKITPFLLFNQEAEAAAPFYMSVFNGKLLDIKYYLQDSALPGVMLTATFEILGITMPAMDFGREAKCTESISFAIKTETQEEVGHYWNALIADGGTEGNCSWLKDNSLSL
jgi:predicted 3-demethylubiquinone-9 3-methyltransferase (glyoxalase superfamily)